MKRLLSNSQRQAVLKTVCLVLALVMFVGVILFIPRLVSVIPRFSASATREMLKATDIVPQSKPAFAFGSGGEVSIPKDNLNSPKPAPLPEINVPIPQPQEGDLPVASENLCWYSVEETPTLNLINRTSYDVDLNDFITREFPISGEITDKPLVLIIHTHGSESYLPTKQSFYSPDEDFRSESENENVVGIGSILCEELNQMGIPTIHDKTMHDIPNYNSSYVTSSKALEKILAENPSIRFVIDLHRDSVVDANENIMKPLTKINGKDCAQLMIVAGTNEMGIPHPNWRDNLTFATYLQQEINTLFPTLARPVNLRKQEFNQSYTKGSIILEVGSCGNTVEEARNTIYCFAQAYGNLLKKHLT